METIQTFCTLYSEERKWWSQHCDQPPFLPPFGSVECSEAQKPRVSKSIKNSVEGYVIGREGVYVSSGEKWEGEEVDNGGDLAYYGGQ